MNNKNKEMPNFDCYFFKKKKKKKIEKKYGTIWSFFLV